MAGIFISYRRDDSRHAAGRLADELAAEFGAASIFRDVESIAPGVDFEEALDQALSACAVMLVVIGPRWLSITDAEGRDAGRLGAMLSAVLMEGDDGWSAQSLILAPLA